MHHLLSLKLVRVSGINIKTIEKITVWRDNLKEQLKDIKDYKCNLAGSQLEQNMRANEKYQENSKN